MDNLELKLSEMGKRMGKSIFNEAITLNTAVQEDCENEEKGGE